MSKSKKLIFSINEVSNEPFCYPNPTGWILIQHFFAGCDIPKFTIFVFILGGAVKEELAFTFSDI